MTHNILKTHIEGLKKGSYKDFKVLYDTFSVNLYGFVFGLVKSESVAKNIVHETFIKIWMNRENIDPEQSFKSYLFKISKNKIIDSYRQKLSDPVMENYLDYCDSVQLSEENDISTQMDYDVFIQKLKYAKSKLTARQREIFELNKEQGISSKEISQKLNITEQTTYNILSTAMRILKSEISPIELILFILFFK